MTKLRRVSEIPQLTKEWDYEKNDISPDEITVGSSKKVWWKCEKGHSWKAFISNRAKGNGCPYCSGRNPVVGQNDLQTLRPELLNEWDWEKNSILPNQFTLHSMKKVWWICEKGHSWQAQICERVKGSNCPYCTNKKLMIGFNDLETRNPELLKEWDYDKNTILPSEVMYGTARKVWWKCEKGHSWEASVCTRSRTRENRKGSFCPICIGKQVLKGFNDLETLDPELVKEWDYDLNELLPSQVTKWSTKKVWWKCKNGHSWEARVMNRSAGNKCPFCYGKTVLAGLNDLETLYPQVAREWDFDKNALNPHQVRKSSHRYAWWKCEKGHSWNATIASRTSGGNGCPYCSGNKVLQGYNDLETLRPELVKEWDYEKNSFLPSQVTIASKRYVWWKCEEGHSWRTTVSSRGKLGSGCPYCLGKRLVKGQNDLETVYPDKAKMWDYEKNHILPSEVTKSSNQRVWWKCEKGHSWEEKVAAVKGCPFCSGHRIIEGFNDLATLRPEIAKEWDYDKNELKPTQVSPSSSKVAWWKCERGHSWKTIISTRGHNGCGCPYCSGNNVVDGVNDLATINPKLSSEWDYEKNDLKPNQVAVSSNRLVWWKCEKGHSWRATVACRSWGGNGCPYCRGRIPYTSRCVN